MYPSGYAHKNFWVYLRECKVWISYLPTCCIVNFKYVCACGCRMCKIYGEQIYVYKTGDKCIIVTDNFIYQKNYWEDNNKPSFLECHTIKSPSASTTTSVWNLNHLHAQLKWFWFILNVTLMMAAFEKSLVLWICSLTFLATILSV